MGWPCLSQSACVWRSGTMFRMASLCQRDEQQNPFKGNHTTLHSPLTFDTWGIRKAVHLNYTYEPLGLWILWILLFYVNIRWNCPSFNQFHCRVFFLFKQPRRVLMFAHTYKVFCIAACKWLSPVIVVHVLAYECVRLHRAICIHLGHVHVVYEVDQSPAARRSVVASRFLLEGFFQHSCVGDEWTRRERRCRRGRMNTLNSNIYGIVCCWRISVETFDLTLREHKPVVGWDP